MCIKVILKIDFDILQLFNERHVTIIKKKIELYALLFFDKLC